MRIVYSFWTKPIGQMTGSPDDRFNGGWLSSKANFCSWSLSCLKSLEHYDEVELYTDQLGKYLLVDLLQLPFTKVETVLDQLNDYPPACWAIGKVFTYSLQKSPFLHIDSDVFLGAKIPEHLAAQPLIAQSREVNQPFYKKALALIAQHGNPHDLLNVQDPNQLLICSNAGVIGGHDTDLFDDLYRQAQSFILNNEVLFKTVEDPGLLNIIFEQLFFHNLSIQKGTSISYFFGKRIPVFTELVRFGRFPEAAKYIHVFGGDLKKSKRMVNYMELMLRQDYPSQYYRLQHLVKALKL